MKEAGLLVAVGVLVLSVAAGCGHTITVETTGGGDGGGGGNGGAGGSVTTSSSSSSTMTSTPTTSGQYCAYFCGQLDLHGCLKPGQDADCTKDCYQIFDVGEQCPTEIHALYDCILSQVSANGCEIGEACKQAAEALTTCIEAPKDCALTKCSSGDGACGCKLECKGQLLQVECENAPNGVQCDCLIDGQSVGTCVNAELTCKLDEGCCAGYFTIDN